MIPAVYFIQKWEKEIELQSQPGQRGHFVPAWVLSFLHSRKLEQAEQDMPSRNSGIKTEGFTLLRNDLPLEVRPSLCCSCD